MMILTPKVREHMLGIQKLFRFGYKISAIKLFREFQECSITDAKEYLEEHP